MPEPSDQARRLLAVAFVAEAGWAPPRRPKAEADHRAIFHVLKNRWRNMRKRWPKKYGEFSSVVQVYVAAMDPRTKKGGRVRWLLALSTPGAGADGPPAGWPVAHARWARHRVWWRDALERAERCLYGGRCRDPYRGKALHWGGAMDPPRGCMVELPNVGTYNTFYAVDTTCRRRR